MTAVKLFNVSGNAEQVRLVQRAIRRVDDDFPWDLAATRLKRRYGLDAIPVSFEKIPAQPGLPAVLWGQVSYTGGFRARFKPDLANEDPDRVTSNILHELIGHAVTDGCLLFLALRTAVMGLMPGKPTAWSGQDYSKRPMEGWAETAVALHSDVKPAFRGLYSEDIPAKDFPKLRAVLSQFGTPYAFPVPPKPPVSVPDPAIPDTTDVPPEPAPTPEPPVDPTAALQARIDELTASAALLQRQLSVCTSQKATAAGKLNDLSALSIEVALELTGVPNP